MNKEETTLEDLFKDPNYLLRTNISLILINFLESVGVDKKLIMGEKFNKQYEDALAKILNQFQKFLERVSKK